MEKLPVGIQQAVSGNVLLMKEGKPIEKFEGSMAVRHPRTVVGIDRSTLKLMILVVDGRRPGLSVGMTGAELASEMKRLGCWDAINLDGGGSTTLVMRDPATNELQVLNQPSDNRERPVSDAIGITFTHQTTRPAPGADPLNN